MWLFLAFLLVPLIEIALFIQVGGAIGLWPTLAIVILTAIAGTWLVRTQGRAALSQLRGSLGAFSDPTRPLAHGAMIIFSGALLLTPGFFTDAVGFALLIPAVRDVVMREAGKRIRVRPIHPGGPAGHPGGPAGAFRPDRPDPGGRRPGPVVDGEWEELPPDAPASGRKSGGGARRPSGWTRGE